MIKARHVAVLALVVLAVTGCTVEPPPPPVEGRIIHKEYIPASLHKDAPVWNGVVYSDPGTHTLEKQCWRIDVEKKEPVPGTEYVKTYVEWYCIFPSEFDTLNVGDKYTEPKVKY